MRVNKQVISAICLSLFFLSCSGSLLAEDKLSDGHMDEHEHHHGQDGHVDEHEHHHVSDEDADKHEHHHKK